MPDLDQGGASRQWIYRFLGHSVGWTLAPVQNTLPITFPGTFTLDPSTTLVQVNVAGIVTIVLPSAALPTSGALAQPGLFVQSPITIEDVGGNALNYPITIQPKAGDTIMGLSAIQITARCGAVTLTANPAQRLWSAISP